MGLFENPKIARKSAPVTTGVKPPRLGGIATNLVDAINADESFHVGYGVSVKGSFIIKMMRAWGEKKAKEE